MGQFKPMVKMMTDEPSVILKLKKGGKVKSKAAGQSDAFKSMASNNAKVFEDAETGMAPKKPSMAERRKAMNPNMYAKGGKVAHKQMGGGMPMAATPGMVPGANSPAPAPMQAMGRAALAGMAPNKRAMRMAAVQRALGGMKKGGSADCAALEKELKHHEAMSMSKAHPMKKASGGAIDKFETKTTIEGNAGKYAKTKMDTAKKDRAHGTGQIKEKNSGGYAMGGTIEGNEKAYENTKMHTAKRDTAHGTGGIKERNAGGYAKGGKVSGIGRAIEGGNWENRPADTAKPGKMNGTTGGVKEGNGGGYKMGGLASKKAYATGGTVDTGKPVAMPRKPVSRPIANSLQSGTFAKGGKVDYYTDLAKRLEKNPEKPNLRLLKTHTGPKGHVAKVYKDRDWGEHRVKFYSPEGKHFPDSDYHTDDLSDAHDTAQGQLNRYKKGGKVRFAEGGSEDMSKGGYDAHYANEKAENESMRNMILDPLKSLGNHVMRSFDPEGYFKGDERKKLFETQSRMGLADRIKENRAKGQGAVTETEKSVTVTPAGKKRGGRAC
jgi:hypothetical protein